MYKVETAFNGTRSVYFKSLKAAVEFLNDDNKVRGEFEITVDSAEVPLQNNSRIKRNVIKVKTLRRDFKERIGNMKYGGEIAFLCNGNDWVLTLEKINFRG